jgi:hypothetical protein
MRLWNGPGEQGSEQHKHTPAEQPLGTGRSVRAPKLAGPATLDAPNPSPVQPPSGTEGLLMAGKHRLKGRRVQHTPRRRAIEVIDALTLTTHFLTTDAMAAGRLPEGRYTTLCGQDVLPACLTEPGSGRCASCVSIPRQRSGSS